VSRFIPAFALALAVTLPARATTVGPLLTLDASPGTASQRLPALAFDGTRYVMVWEDSRSSGNGRELFLARLGTDGTIQDAMGIPVLSPAQPGDQTSPSIAWNGSSYIITWTDPRLGSQEIYVSRFFPAGMGLLPEPGGTALTNTAGAAEVQPQVACAVQSCLVVFQQTSMGRTEVRGVRVYPSGDAQDLMPLDLVANNTGATTELGPAVTATIGSFYVGWEDDRSNGLGNLGAELFLRTVPDLGMVSPVAGTPLATGAFRQSATSLAMLGPSTIIAVWEDQRTSTSTAPGVEDLWRARFTLNLNPQGAAVAINDAPREQIRPRVATARDGTGLVVWEDFRSGPIGSTWATRLDTNGLSVDRLDFPVLVQPGIMIEHAVAKGPGNDYLVVSVRSQPAPAKIFYRIVRAEDPAGTMSPTGTLTVPANGVAVASVTFGPARGASGFEVVDRTRYTLTLSRQDVTVNVPDLDPATPGIQLETVSGQLTFGVTSLRPGPLTVSVASEVGTSAGTALITFQNVAPTVSGLVIAPSMPRSDQDLTLTYVYNDLNGDLEMGSRIQWTSNGMLMPAFANMRTIPASATLRNQIWRASVQASDGADFNMSFVFSAPVTILNTPPSAADVRITPGAAVKTGTALRADYRFVDPDLDPETGSVLRWSLNGMVDATLNGVRDIPAARIVKGQTWSFTIVPSDGTDAGPRVDSATVTVENSIPVADAGMNGNVLERRALTLSGAASSDIDPQDTLQFTWTQTRGPMVTLMGADTAAPSFTAPSVAGTTQLEFQLVVSDGESPSPADRVVVLIGFVPDGDGDDLDDEEEMALGTDPARGDSDRDGLSDGVEVHDIHTLPLDEDSDDDGLRDGMEIDPGADPDMDTLVNALDPDSDNDGLGDGTEAGLISAPMGTDQTMGFFTPDSDRMSTTDPHVADSDGDGISDGMEDTNKNGRVDLGESDPNDRASTVGCMPDRSCPSGLSCIEDACRPSAMPDAGMMCTTLASQNLECCSACFGGTAAVAFCPAGGRAEQCPAGAQQCRAGSCSAAVVPPMDSGCATTGASTMGMWWVAIAVLFARRRRR